MNVKRTWRERWARWAGVDLRSLALLRFVLGVVLALDVLARFCDLGAFYTDAGVMPRDAANASLGPWHISVHLANGAAWFAALLLLVELFAALALAAGCRTRVANLVAFVLHGSLLNRNLAILVPTDTLLVCLLFWGLFVPLNARWSVDAVFAENPAPENKRHLSAGGVGLLVQALCVLVLSLATPDASASDHREWALGALLVLLLMPAGTLWDWLARRVDHGRYLRIYYDGECSFCHTSALVLRELLALPRTEILPAQGSARATALMQAQESWVVIDGHDVAHTKWNGFVALLRQSLLFGWLAPFFALPVWERPGTLVYEWIGRRRRALGTLSSRFAARRPVRFETGRAPQAFAAIVAIAVVAWNATNLQWLPASTTRWLAPLIEALRIEQRWPVFTPALPQGWFVIPGIFDDGSERDLLTRKPVDWSQPADLSAIEPSRRWRLYHAALLDPSEAADRERYARWLCAVWNRAPARPRLASLQLTYVTQDVASTSAEQRVLLRYRCP